MPAQKKSKSRPRNGVTVTNKLPPWGATKQAADAFEQIRKLKNRVYELEQKLVAVGTEDTSWFPTGTEIDALGKVIQLPLATVHSLSMMDAFPHVCRMFTKLDQWNRKRLRALAEAIRMAPPEVGDEIFIHADVRGREEPFRARVEEAPDSSKNGTPFFFSRILGGTKAGQRVVRLVRDEGSTWSRP